MTKTFANHTAFRNYVRELFPVVENNDLPLYITLARLAGNINKHGHDFGNTIYYNTVMQKRIINDNTALNYIHKITDLVNDNELLIVFESKTDKAYDSVRNADGSYNVTENQDPETYGYKIKI